MPYFFGQHGMWGFRLKEIALSGIDVAHEVVKLYDRQNHCSSASRTTPLVELPSDKHLQTYWLQSTAGSQGEKSGASATRQTELQVLPCSGSAVPAVLVPLFASINWRSAPATSFTSLQQTKPGYIPSRRQKGNSGLATSVGKALVSLLRLCRNDWWTRCRVGRQPTAIPTAVGCQNSGSESNNVVTTQGRTVWRFEKPS